MAKLLSDWLAFSCLIIHFLLGHVSALLSNMTNFVPLTIGLGNAPVYPVNGYQAGNSFTLNPSTPFATLDYSREVAGHPLFFVSSASGKVQIEVKYSEQFSGLSAPFSDGPYPFAVGLSNTYRVETLEITKPGTIEGFLLQGGLRWQSIHLLTTGTVTFSAVGLNATIPTADVDSLPSSFTCSNPLLNNIWNLGARTVEATCVEQGSQSALWEVNSNGAFIRGMRPGVSADVRAAELQDYTLQFDVNIQRAGMGWTVAMPLQFPNTGIQLGITGELPAATTFVNTNTNLTPKNSITLAYGYSIVNQTTLPSYFLQTFPLPFPVHEQTWYNITTLLAGGKYLAVSVQNQMVFNVSLSQFYIGGSAISTAGSFGFGGWQDQASYVRNVQVHSTATGALLYSNPMTNASLVLQEYGVHQNFHSVCLDGAKRDRLVWLDFYHTAQIIGASTARYDLIQSNLQYFLDWQTSAGLIPINPPMGYDHSIGESAFTLGGGGLSPFQIFTVALPDYQILGLTAFTNYVYETNDLVWTKSTWSQWQAQAAWITSQINSTTGLLSLQGQVFLGGGNGGSAINCAFVNALNRLAIVATAIGDAPSATKYQTLAASLSTAINKSLWNSKLGAYSLSLDSLNHFDLAGNSFCVISSVANGSQATQAIAKLSTLKLGPGYKDSSRVSSSDSTVNLSPFTNGFFLDALLFQGSTSASTTALNLLNTLWGAMLADNKTTTGASWELVNQQSQPGLGLFTSLSAAWAGSPTYLLTRYVAGIQQANNAPGLGYKDWVIDPSAGLAMGLTSASGNIIAGFLRELDVSWAVVKTAGYKQLNVDITAPSRASTGVFVLNGTKKVLSGSGSYSFTVKL